MTECLRDIQQKQESRMGLFPRILLPDLSTSQSLSTPLHIVMVLGLAKKKKNSSSLLLFPIHPKIRCHIEYPLTSTLITQHTLVITAQKVPCLDLSALESKRKLPPIQVTCLCLHNHLPYQLSASSFTFSCGK